MEKLTNVEYPLLHALKAFQSLRTMARSNYAFDTFDVEDDTITALHRPRHIDLKNTFVECILRMIHQRSMRLMNDS